MKTINSLLALASLSLLLTACGGGGSAPANSAPPASSSPSAAPAAVSSINSTIAPAGYTAGSAQSAVYQLINSERTSCGFGSLSQSAQLDQAALAHANWLLVNNFWGHFEVATSPAGYTGVTPVDRAEAAGYAFGVGARVVSGEVQAETNSTGGDPLALARELLSVPYHLAGLLDGFQQVGIGYEDSNAAGSTASYGARTVLNIDFGVPSGQTDQDLGASDVLTYPCAGSTGAALAVTGENPSPASPGRNLATQPYGPAIMVMVRAGQTLALTSATMTDLATGAAVTLDGPRTTATDPNPSELTANVGYWLPDSPLSPNTSYQVTLTGSNDGTAFSRTFTFTTGS